MASCFSSHAFLYVTLYPNDDFMCAIIVDIGVEGLAWMIS